MISKAADMLRCFLCVCRSRKSLRKRFYKETFKLSAGNIFERSRRFSRKRPQPMKMIFADIPMDRLDIRTG